MFEDFDKQVSIWTESFARRFSRRKVIGTTIKGLFASVAAVTVGQLTDLKITSCICTCNDCWHDGMPCEEIGHACPPQGGCPNPACRICTSNGDNNCGGWCSYTNGQWISCGGLGPHGKGYMLCTDCKCLHCNHKCTCQSQCICCNCSTPQDVQAEMQRLAAVSA